jgi:hypothetical protein
MTIQTQGPVFTPRTPTGERLRFLISDVTIVSGNIMESGRAMKATVKVAGRTYAIKGASCGAGCFCDALATDITEASI